jgi:hypothetical protein
VQHVPTMSKNLVSGYHLCRDGFKLVLESNNVVVFKHGQFIGKGYECIKMRADIRITGGLLFMWDVVPRF